ncbi:MAG: hypothetical protein WCC17_19295 [Candidatus Nitrosopolaris sp.]
MTIGPDGKPKVREFGNVKSSRGFGGISRPEISGEMEPLVDVSTTDKEVKVVVEMPGLSKDKIMVNVNDGTLESEEESRAKILKGNTIALLKYHQKRI